MNRKFILLVEDNERAIELFHDAVNDWNNSHAGEEKVFVPIVSKDAAEALARVEEVRIDCALTDLRLPSKAGVKGQAAVGNDLAFNLLNLRGIPLALVSAHPTEVDEALSSIGMVKVFSKDEAYVDALAWLANQWSMMETLRLARNRIEESTGSVFLRRIWPQWAQLEKLGNMDADRLARAISRQYASHTAEHLTHSEETKWHPFESYIVPSFIDDRAHTGDVFDFNDGRWVVLTPQCDMANGKVENVLVAKCCEDWEGWKASIEALKGLKAEGDKLKAELSLKALVNQNVPVSQHFLPPLPGESAPVQVRFSSVRTIPLAELNESLSQRVATVSPPFLSNLIQRFGSFVSRTGQPDINVEDF